MGFEEYILLIKIIAALIATVVYFNNKAKQANVPAVEIIHAVND